MTESRTRLFTWAPRALLILFALFLALFSLDVIEQGKSAGEIAAGLAAHNLPSMLLLVVLAAAWRWEWIGAIACTALGVFYIAWSWGAFPLAAYLTISGPLFVISYLYAVNWRRKLEAGKGA